MDDDIDAAVALEQVLGDLRRRIVVGDVERERGATELARGPLELLGHRRHVDANHVGAVAGEDLRDGGADAAGGAGDERDLAGERPIPVDLRHRALGGRDPNHLADTYADLGEMKKRRLDSSRVSAFGAT